jgi:hypothetical protein
MSFTLGSTLAGLLNASFGNAVEIIVGIAALLQGMVPFCLGSLNAYISCLRRTYHRPELSTHLPHSVKPYLTSPVDAGLYPFQHSSCPRNVIPRRLELLLPPLNYLLTHRLSGGIKFKESNFQVTAAQA